MDVQKVNYKITVTLQKNCKLALNICQIFHHYAYLILQYSNWIPETVILNVCIKTYASKFVFKPSTGNLVTEIK